MGKFLKTWAICFTLCAGIFAQNTDVDFSIGENPQERYNHLEFLITL